MRHRAYWGTQYISAPGLVSLDRTSKIFIADIKYPHFLSGATSNESSKNNQATMECTLLKIAKGVRCAIRQNCHIRNMHSKKLKCASEFHWLFTQTSLICCSNENVGMKKWRLRTWNGNENIKKCTELWQEDD